LEASLFSAGRVGRQQFIVGYVASLLCGSGQYIVLLPGIVEASMSQNQQRQENRSGPHMMEEFRS
jgi:hypothetical protein